MTHAKLTRAISMLETLTKTDPLDAVTLVPVLKLLRSLASDLAETAESAEAFSMRISDCCDLIPSGHVWNVQRGRTLIEQRDARLLSRGSGWVACSERMPEPDVEVLVHDGTHVDVGEYHNGWHAVRSPDAIEPTHWMPLPAPPPKADEGEG